MKKTYETAKVIYDLLTSTINPRINEVFVSIRDEYYSVSKFATNGYSFIIEKDFIKTNDKYTEINNIVKELTIKTEESNKNMALIKNLMSKGLI